MPELPADPESAVPEFPAVPIWEEPVRGSYPHPGVLARSGRDRGELIPPPPIHHLMGLAPQRGAEPGTSVFTMPCSPWFQSSVGVFLAGVYALVADAPFGGAIVSMLDPGVVGTTSELSMNFLRPADPSSVELTARGRLIDVGRTLGLSETVVTDARGRRLAHGTSRYFLRRIGPLPGFDGEPPPVEVPTFPTPDPWARPMAEELPSPDDLHKRTGLELFEASRTGDLPPPPFSRLFGISIDGVREGAVTFSQVASEWLQSPARTIYGGMIAMLADTAMIAAITTTLPAGHSCATLDFKVNYLRPGLADGRPITATGHVVHRGRSIAVARADLLNGEGKPMAIATGSAMILERPWASVAVADEAEVED